MNMRGAFHPLKFVKFPITPAYQRSANGIHYFSIIKTTCENKEVIPAMPSTVCYTTALLGLVTTAIFLLTLYAKLKPLPNSVK